MLSNDANVAALSDIFRLFKINGIQVTFQPQTGTSSASVQMPVGFIAFVPYGTTAAPTSMSDFETPLVSNPTVGFGTTTTVTSPLLRETGTSLSLKPSDMPILQGNPGGFLATQDDGTQHSFGNLFWALAATTAANTINYLLTTHFDISFKDLLDPGLISKVMARHPQGLPDHWIPIDIDPSSHALGPYTFSSVFQRRMSKTLSAPSLGLLGLPPPLESENPQQPPSVDPMSVTRTLVDPSTGRTAVVPSAFVQWSNYP